MNTKSKKGIVGITFAAIMIASIFAMINPAIVASPGPATVDGQVNPGDEWDNSLITIDDPKDVSTTWDSGYDIDKVYVIYEDDTLYIRVDVYGTPADTDGDGDPNGNDGSVNPGMSDYSGVGGGAAPGAEEYYIDIDADGDCDFDEADYRLRYTQDDSELLHYLGGSTGAVTDEAYGTIVELSLEDASDYIDPMNFCIQGWADNNPDGIGEDWTDKVCFSGVPPVFEFDFEHICCLNMEFDGSASYDPDGTIVNHTWDFGDGTPLLEVSGEPTGTVEHTYSSCGNYWVTLSGCDDEGFCNSTPPTQVHVPCGPTAVARASPTRIDPGDTVTFGGSLSTGELDRALWTFTWTFDDGHAPMVGEIVSRPVDTLPLLAMLTVNDSHCEDTDDARVYKKVRGNHTIRVHGEDSQGPGDIWVTDPITGNVVENPPYTADTGPFDEWEQSPPKDYLTFNPAFLSEKESRDELYASGLYSEIHTDEGDALEKVFFRMWYEPLHWDKDVDANGLLECVIRDGADGQGETAVLIGSDDIFTLGGYVYLPPPDTCVAGAVLILPGPDGILQSVPGDVNGDGVVDVRATDDYIECDPDVAYPAIMQEFTYMLLESDMLSDKPEPTEGKPGETAIVFPVGMREADIDNPKGFGLTSLDADFDGKPDIVFVESEISLFEKTHIAADFDGSGTIDPLDWDGEELSGDELAVFTTATTKVYVGEKLQFLDHMIEVVGVYDSPGAVKIKIWYTGDLTPKYLGTKTIQVKNMILSGNQGPAQEIIAVENGGDGTNMCDFPTGPWFAWVESMDRDDEWARIMVGRALGHTHTAMEDNPYQPDLEPGDPWFVKRFYVDGHEYKVVAIETEGFSEIYENDCDLDDNDDGIVDVDPTKDESEFKFITIRTTIPKEGEDLDPVVLIAQHSVRLQPYDLRDYLSILPPFNYEHTILLDVQPEWSEPVVYIGGIQTHTIPITQMGNWGTPEDGNDHIYYIEEARNPQFTGELLEKYNQNEEVWPIEEWWYAEQWHTLPDEYTEFSLPAGHGLYLLTSAFWSQQSVWRDCYQDTGCSGTGVGWNRVKFWYDGTCNMTKIYKDNEGIKVYGEHGIGAGAVGITDPLTGQVVENPPYTDPLAPFNPQNPQAPRKDSITFNPAYMDEFYNGGEELAELYAQIGTEEGDAREKVFFRLWYEPEHWDKDINGNNVPDKLIVDGGNGISESFAVIIGADDVQVVPVGDDVDPGDTIVGPGADGILQSVPNGDDIIIWVGNSKEGYPAIMEEFTYIYLDTANLPSHGQPGISQFAFPIGTTWGQLWGDFGFGLTTFNADFDELEDAVTIHSESSLAALTGIAADFDGDGGIQMLDQDGIELNGNEIVIFSKDVNLDQDAFAMFLDHMIEVVDVGDTPPAVELRCYYTGGGYEPSFTPEEMVPATVTLEVGDMAILGPGKVGGITKIDAGGANLGRTDHGAWFVYVDAVDTRDNKASLLIGRALGDTHTAMDTAAGLPDLTLGDPWYMKRFYVDGQEYGVVAIKTVFEEGQGHPEDEVFEFKYITIRTPIPKVPFQITQHTQALQDYYICDDIPVMPPFNYEYTARKDIGKYWTQPYDITPDIFPDDLEDMGYMGELIKNKPPLEIHIAEEDTERRFKVELKEQYWKNEDLEQMWWTEQVHTLPDQYTALELPDDGQLYLLTSSWWAPQAEWRTVNEYNNGPRGFGMGGINWYEENRVKFWYDPASPIDIYVNLDLPRDSTTLIDEYDANKNGYIDREELVDAIIAFLLGEIDTMELRELILNYLLNA